MTTKSDKDTTEKKVHKTVKPKAVGSAVDKKPRTPRKKVEETPKTVSMKEAASAIAQGMGSATETAPLAVKPTLAKDKYQFATGRRKTAIANVRLFSGKGDNVVNKKAFDKYFQNSIYRNVVMKPLEITGLATDFYFTATINGGGVNAQSEALRHGLAQALAALDRDVRKILKKNSYLTRDDRKKERKKPGLRGARRSPQWAKR